MPDFVDQADIQRLFETTKANGGGMKTMVRELVTALPWLESLNGFAHGGDSLAGPRRLLLICLPLGIYREAFVNYSQGRRFRLSADTSRPVPSRAVTQAGGPVRGANSGPIG